MSSNCLSRWGSAALVLLALTGCSAGQVAGRPPVAPAQPPTNTPAPPPTGSGGTVVSPQPPAVEQKLVLYFPHKSKPVLVREERTVVRRGDAPEWSALQELLAGPRSDQARAVFDAGDLGAGAVQPVYGTKVLDGATLVILSQKAAERLTQGGRLAVYAVVNSLVSSGRGQRVAFRVDGDAELPTVDGLDLTQPLEPRWDLAGQ